MVQRVDLMAELIKHPQASFLLRIRGESMRDVGIFDGDVVLVDRAITPALVMWSSLLSKTNSSAKPCR